MNRPSYEAVLANAPACCGVEFATEPLQAISDHRSVSLTVILNSDANVLGGFTPLKGDSSSCDKGDCPWPVHF
jgi:hypothetical protein